MTGVICPKCNEPAPWVENKEKYGRNYGKSYMCYFCKPCGTYVGCHNNTREPLGTLADKETQQWRIKTHAVLDPLWKKQGYKRGNVYYKLDDYFGESIHIGESNIERCKEIMRAVEKIFN